MAKLSKDDIQLKLSHVFGWQLDGNSIYKEFNFKDFKESLNFINKVGDEAEKMDHHPDINLHSYNKVKLVLSTHSEGGLTNKDFKLAEIINNF
ncbi:MAG TPA: 4a-hydroxytetrahydrobiopterin dehydratase [Ignavibacteriaceae bacterium]|nr:4a-hydroxytetrahydrobiopterin dehydratase [Ignavibacteriaceae bacterium]